MVVRIVQHVAGRRTGPLLLDNNVPVTEFNPNLVMTGRSHR
jgi:hypothetical protein